jgi:hypothetical protein
MKIERSPKEFPPAYESLGGGLEVAKRERIYSEADISLDELTAVLKSELQVGDRFYLKRLTFGPDQNPRIREGSDEFMDGDRGTGLVVKFYLCEIEQDAEGKEYVVPQVYTPSWPPTRERVKDLAPGERIPIGNFSEGVFYKKKE